MPLIRWTYYLIPRMILAILFSVFTVYGAVYTWNEKLFTGIDSIPLLLVLLAVILSFLFAWQVWNALGRIQLSGLLKKAKRAIAEKDYIEGRHYYRKALNLTESSHYAAETADFTRQKYFSKYADFLCSAGSNDRDALDIYARYFKIYPEDAVFADRIIPLLKSSDDIADRHLHLLVRLHNLQPRYDDFADFTAEQFLIREIYSADSQEVFLLAIRRDSPLKQKVLKFLMPRMIAQDRADINALEVYLQAFFLKIEHRNLKPMLGRIAEKARFEENPGPLSRMILEAFDEMPKKEREEIKSAVRLERLRKVPLKTESPVDEEFEFDGEITDIAEFDRLAKFRKRFSEFLIKLPGSTLNGVLFILKFVAAKWNYIKWGLAVLMLGIMLYGGVRVVFFNETADQVSLEVMSDKPFTIQIAAFKEKERAERFIRDTAEKGIKPYYVITEGQTTWYQVRLGHFGDMNEARTKADSLKAEEAIASYFIANFQPGFYVE